MKMTDAKFASTRRVERLEQEINDLRRALESHVEVVVELRSAVAPLPGELLFTERVHAQSESGSPVVRSGRRVGGANT